MKKTILNSISCLIVLASGSLLSAQNITDLESVLKQVEENSPRLIVAAKQLGVDKLESASLKILENPEIEFNYLWGQNSEVGNRKDFSITQSFDFATISGRNAKLSASMEELALIAYRAEKLDVMTEAKAICADLACLNELISAYELYYQDICALRDFTEKKAELGEATVFDSAKAKMQQATIQAFLSKTKMERESLLSQLRVLSGVEGIDFKASFLELKELDDDFDSYYSSAAQNSPALQYVAQELQIASNSLKVEKSAWVPSITVGYMAELGHSDQYRGLTMGLSIPLWSNKNKVRVASATADLASERQNEQVNKYFSEFKTLWINTKSLEKTSKQNREMLNSTDNRSLMLSAVLRGEISMLDYIVDQESYYSLLEDTLNLERDYNKSLIELQKYSGEY